MDDHAVKPTMSANITVQLCQSKRERTARLEERVDVHQTCGQSKDALRTHSGNSSAIGAPPVRARVPSPVEATSALGEPSFKKDFSIDFEVVTFNDVG
jgi:hypothetical protein